MMVTTINVNGVRAAVRERSPQNRGLLVWLAHTKADVVCLQETRAQVDQVADALAPALANGWFIASASSQIKGRNGVAILSRVPFREVRIGLADEEFDQQGRYLEVDIDSADAHAVRDTTVGDNAADDNCGITIASVYVHTGEAGTDRQQEKERFMAALAKRMVELASSRRPALVCGDWNIAHTENDIKAWKANTKKAGFLPGERQWVSELIDAGWVDVMRRIHPDTAGPYSWWSWRGKAFDNDAGWRIDYHLATADLAARAVSARVERPEAYSLRWSDHAPVSVTLNLNPPLHDRITSL